MAIARVGQANCGNDWPAEDGADKYEDLEGVNCLNCTPKPRLHGNTAALPAHPAMCEGNCRLTVSDRSQASHALRTSDAVILGVKIREEQYVGAGGDGKEKERKGIEMLLGWDGQHERSEIKSLSPQEGVF